VGNHFRSSEIIFDHQKSCVQCLRGPIHKGCLGWCLIHKGIPSIHVSEIMCPIHKGCLGWCTCADTRAIKAGCASRGQSRKTTQNTIHLSDEHISKGGHTSPNGGGLPLIYVVISVYIHKYWTLPNRLVSCRRLRQDSILGSIRQRLNPCRPCWPILAYASPCWLMLAHGGSCWPMLPYADPCWPMLAHVANAAAVSMPQACQTRVKMYGPSTQSLKTQCVCSLIWDLSSYSVAEWWCPHVQVAEDIQDLLGCWVKRTSFYNESDPSKPPVVSLFVHVLKASHLSGGALSVGPRDARVIDKHSFLLWFMQVSERRKNGYIKKTPVWP